MDGASFSDNLILKKFPWDRACPCKHYRLAPPALVWFTSCRFWSQILSTLKTDSFVIVYDDFTCAQLSKRFSQSGLYSPVQSDQFNQVWYTPLLNPLINVNILKFIICSSTMITRQVINDVGRDLCIFKALMKVFSTAFFTRFLTRTF